MNPLVLQIHDEIQRRGPISFARYMELALYAPGLGYYERRRDIGRRGDFYTSVSVGPVFGELLAHQFAEWLEAGGAGERVQIVEAGAHDGTLAADILRWLQRWRTELFERVEYCLVEPSSTHRAWQAETLREWLPRVKWVTDISDLNSENVARIIFCNEFLDAMPVHRLAWDAKNRHWQECLVAFENGKFAWQRAAPPAELAKALPKVEPELAAVLPDGFVIEHSPAAETWWKQAAARLARGKLLTLDYGWTNEERFRPERAQGTLRTFARHHGGNDLLDQPGECDITAHVNFSAIGTAGCAAGLATDALLGQEQFLTRILARIEANPGGFEPWTPARTRQFQTLTHPDHLGRAFRALIQSPRANSERFQI
jgi:SAM-dependent MidA family methyltransferase